MKSPISTSRLSLALAATLISLGTGITTAPTSAQDIAKGKKMFRKCKACHAIGEGAKNNNLGTILSGVVGRPAGSIEGFKYSSTMTESGLTWAEETLTAFLAKTRDFAKGTKMTFAGLRKEADIANVIAYLATFNAYGTTK